MNKEIINDLRILLDKVKKQFQNGNNGIIASSSGSLAISEQTTEELQKIINKYELR